MTIEQMHQEIVNLIAKVYTDGMSGEDYDAHHEAERLLERIQLPDALRDERRAINKWLNNHEKYHEYKITSLKGDATDPSLISVTFSTVEYLEFMRLLGNGERKVEVSE